MGQSKDNREGCFIYFLGFFRWWREAGTPELNVRAERKWPLSAQATTSMLHYWALTPVIVQVADSVTESSSGKFITETPQTSGKGPLPAG